MNSPTRIPPLRHSILVVDDDENTREAVRDALSREYRVILAVDGIDGYERANEQPPPDLIIADIDMPRLGGLAMARRIRDNDALRRVPIIFFAGEMPPASVLAVSFVDPFSCLPKPVDLDVLEKSVKRLLS
jgi:CheY-like chemotaxis protein